MVSKLICILFCQDILLRRTGLASAQNIDTRSQECLSESLTKNVSDLANLYDHSDDKQAVTQIDSQGNIVDNNSITEAASPSNNTVPAPRTAQGLGSDIGKNQDLDPSYSEMIFEKIEKAREYIYSKVMVEDLYKNVRTICRNEHSSCAFWSVLGECENNPAYMHVNCAPVCETCEVRKPSRKIQYGHTNLQRKHEG